jgi:hypothetical protein
LRPLGDAGLEQQPREQHRRGLGVGRGVVRADERDVVAQAEVAQAVGSEPVRIERAGQAQGAEAQRVRDVDTSSPEGPREEQPVELGVVRAHDAAVEQVDQLTRHTTQPGRATEHPP